MNEEENYLNLTKTEQINMIENILIDLWDKNKIELIGFNENNEPMFRNIDK